VELIRSLSGKSDESAPLPGESTLDGQRTRKTLHGVSERRTVSGLKNRCKPLKTRYSVFHGLSWTEGPLKQGTTQSCPRVSTLRAVRLGGLVAQALAC
jgi:hypothetical protein